MEYIDNIKQIEEIYGTPGQAALLKVAKQMTPAYRDWIARSRFVFCQRLARKERMHRRV